jgi:hypothetical protein
MAVQKKIARGEKPGQKEKIFILDNSVKNERETARKT